MNIHQIAIGQYVKLKNGQLGKVKRTNDPEAKVEVTIKLGTAKWETKWIPLSAIADDEMASFDADMEADEAADAA